MVVLQFCSRQKDRSPCTPFGYLLENTLALSSVQSAHTLLVIASAATCSLHYTSGLSKCQGCKGLSVKGNGPGKAKTLIDDIAVWPTVVARGRTANLRIVAPTAAAEHTKSASRFI
jgi:hypothetical protein